MDWQRKDPIEEQSNCFSVRSLRQKVNLVALLRYGLRQASFNEAQEPIFSKVDHFLRLVNCYVGD